ncbi:exodeoxyribonuclease VII large subunit [Ferruginivarius sediminum]|uniref:Exodeoxyribonuclease 7 large subunit n=2 Tax=Ferruginivarius sediminum TaxID=2661937 RepID=A0A369TCX7_9PROT|nr:exodeoxyribonuclease VII large subunit [Ferruginivarius sediminum]
MNSPNDNGNGDNGGRDNGGRDNVPIFTVAEISQAVKRTVEGAFQRVRVRGEISRPSFPSSGHCYFRLKDENAVLDSVVWRGVLGRLKLRPEDGLEVIASGRLTTYAGKSSYQIIVDSLELAGEGALLKLLEERRKKLAAEGLFAEERKRPLPYLPEVIGVVTSPTGSVIRDILHRLADRFPRRVLVWPVAVQGEQAAPQVAEAIRGFNALPKTGPVPRPDVLIVARGGGSLEDLWAFNEEEVVRAAADSTIPLISAVGHETDTTLIDFAADRRAPTPSAAAEIAVPVKSELTNLVLDLSRRLASAGYRGLEERRTRVEGLARGLPDPQRMLQEMSQRLDDRAERLTLGVSRFLRQEAEKVESLGWRLPRPEQQLGLARERLDATADRLVRSGARNLESRREQYLRVDAERRLDQGIANVRRDTRRQLDQLGRLLDSYSYHKTLERGFAVVRDADGQGVLTRKGEVQAGQSLDIEFADGHAAAVAAGGAAQPKGKAGGNPGGSPGGSGGKARAGKTDGKQGSLL